MGIMRRVRRARTVLTLCLLALPFAVRAAPADAAVAGAVAVPTSSMAALGDSYTAACSAVPSDQCAVSSWSTGTSPAVNSHLLRLQRRSPGVLGSNFASAGRKMSDLQRQAQLAAGVSAEYVTIMMGTNDVCASEPTPISTFRDQFAAALGTLSGALPAARIFVTSIPDPGRLRDVFRDDPNAAARWTADARCPLFLANAGSEAPEDQQRRAQAHAYLAEMNRQLAEVCLQQAQCTYDRGAVTSLGFERADIASDFFHFSAQGEAALAAVTYPVAFPTLLPAKLTVPRASIHDGRLDGLLNITGAATGTAQVEYVAGGRRSVFTVALGAAREGAKNVRVSRPLVAAQRSARTGLLTVTYRGNEAVQPDQLRTRAANARSGLHRGQLSFDAGHLVVRGTIRPEAGGVVRIRVTYADAGGAVAAYSQNARIDNGQWAADAQLPASAASDPNAYVTIQFSGSASARGGPYRGEQLGKSLANLPVS